MLAALGNYTTSDDFISRCMRTADWHSTGTDTSYRYDKQSGIRASDTAARAVAILKDNISILNINGFDSSAERFDKNSPPPVHIMIIGALFTSTNMRPLISFWVSLNTSELTSRMVKLVAKP